MAHTSRSLNFLSTCSPTLHISRSVQIRQRRLPRTLQPPTESVGSDKRHDVPDRIKVQRASVPRRGLLIGLTSLAAGTVSGSTLLTPEAQAWGTYREPPQGFLLHVDRYEGYSFFIPNTWAQVESSEQGCLFLGPSSPEEHMGVKVMPYATSRFIDMSDLGTPEEAGQHVLKQIRRELKTNKSGARREPKLMRADLRTSYDGDDYYEIEVNVKEYPNKDQKAPLIGEKKEDGEGDLYFFTVLGVANKRLYQLRAQVPNSILETEVPKLRQILNSFQIFDVLSA